MPSVPRTICLSSRESFFNCHSKSRMKSTCSFSVAVLFLPLRLLACRNANASVGKLIRDVSMDYHIPWLYVCGKFPVMRIVIWKRETRRESVRCQSTISLPACRNAKAAVRLQTHLCGTYGTEICDANANVIWKREISLTFHLNGEEIDRRGNGWNDSRNNR